MHQLMQCHLERNKPHFANNLLGTTRDGNRGSCHWAFFTSSSKKDLPIDPQVQKPQPWVLANLKSNLKSPISPPMWERLVLDPGSVSLYIPNGTPSQACRLTATWVCHLLSSSPAIPCNPVRLMMLQFLERSTTHHSQWDAADMCPHFCEDLHCSANASPLASLTIFSPVENLLSVHARWFPLHFIM